MGAFGLYGGRGAAAARPCGADLLLGPLVAVGGGRLAPRAAPLRRLGKRRSRRAREALATSPIKCAAESEAACLFQ